MLRSILSAIARGLMSALRFVGRTVTAPLGWFGGGGLAVPPEIPMPQPLVLDESPDQGQIYDDLAIVIMSWAADSIIADGPQALPPRLPIPLREWLPGLSREECWEIMESDRIAVSSHLQRCFTIPGVRPVQPLPAVGEWPAEPARPESAGFAAISLLERHHA